MSKSTHMLRISCVMTPLERIGEIWTDAAASRSSALDKQNMSLNDETKIENQHGSVFDGPFLSPKTDM